MDFGLVRDISEDVNKKTIFIIDLSQNMKNFFNGKTYGAGIGSYVIGVVCVNHDFDKFIDVNNVHKEYRKRKKDYEHDIILDYDVVIKSDEKEIKKMVLTKIIEATVYVTELQIKDFDVEAFKNDLKLFYKQECGEGYQD